MPTASAYFSCPPIAHSHDVKANTVGRQRRLNQAEMIDNIRSYLCSTQYQPRIVQNYFREKYVAYAAA